MFDEFFEAVLADDAESQDAHYRLRFQVYCRETGFESASDFPDGRERDELDERAAAFLVRSRVSGEWIATMRLVIGRVGELPVAPFLDPPHREDPLLAAEISRFCVSPGYRRRTSQEVRIVRPASSPGFRPALRSSAPAFAKPASAGGGRSLRSTSAPRPESHAAGSLLESRDPWILIGLLRAARQYSEERSIGHWFFLAAESMAAAVRMAGFSITEAGPESFHRGPRRAYRYDLDLAGEGLVERSPNVARMFRRRPAYCLASLPAVPAGDARTGRPTAAPEFLLEAAP